MMRASVPVAGLVVLALCLGAGCSGEDDPKVTINNGAGVNIPGKMGKGGDMGGADMADLGADMDADMDADMAADMDADMGEVDMGGADMGDPHDVPSEKAALEAYLDARTYLTLAGESGPHATTGPHGGDVRTYINKALFDSLTDGQQNHPIGAAAVKELYRDGEINGYAVMVKLADTGGVDDWYWYERIGTSIVADGRQESLCYNCHSGGVDMYLSPFPLQ